MAVVYSQWRPISNAETCSDAPLSVRLARDFADGMNGAKRYAMCDKVRSHITAGGASSIDAASERAVLVFAPVVVPRGFVSLRWFVSHWRTGGSGAASVVWTLYSMPGPYRGAQLIDHTVMPGGSQGATVHSTSGTQNVATNTVRIAGAKMGETWLMLTSTRSDATAGAKVVTLDAWPVM